MDWTVQILQKKGKNIKNIEKLFKRGLTFKFYKWIS